MNDRKLHQSSFKVITGIYLGKFSQKEQDNYPWNKHRCLFCFTANSSCPSQSFDVNYKQRTNNNKAITQQFKCLGNELSVAKANTDSVMKKNKNPSEISMAAPLPLI